MQHRLAQSIKPSAVIVRLLLLLAMFNSTTIVYGQSAKEKSFQRTLKNVVTALSSRDSSTLSKYIDKGTGVYIVNRTGVFNTYKHYRTLGFYDDAYPNVPFYDGVKLTTLQYSSLPDYDCETWSKTGTFVDTTEADHLLSETAKNLNKEFENEVPGKTIESFIELENKSRRIVIAENSGNDLVIYLSIINNKWVLTIIDKVTSDCSS